MLPCVYDAAENFVRNKRMNQRTRRFCYPDPGPRSWSMHVCMILDPDVCLYDACSLDPDTRDCMIYLSMMLDPDICMYDAYF